MNVADKKFMKLAIKASKKSTCPREDRHIGAVIVKDGELISEGYNFISEKLKSCCAKCCYRKEHKIASGTCMEKCFSVCAEQLAIKNALQKGVDLTGATIYTTLSPCAVCARWIVLVGITRVVYLNEYYDDFSKNMLLLAGVEIESIKI